MRINLEVTFVGGVSKTVTANAADMVAFENKYNLSIASLSKDAKMSHLLYLAYASEKRTGGTTLDFEKWLETIEGIGASDRDPK
jgi:hypothetical protein